MRHVRLGTTGLQVSPICLGMMSYGDPAWRDWIIPETDAEPFVKLAAASGVNFFDTADMYSNGSSEEVTGRLLKKVFSRREDYVVATKVYFPVGESPNDSGLSRGHILDAVDASLRRLDLDHIDLYQIHRWDPETPIEETMGALDYCVRSGKVRYIGASSMPAWQFAKAQHVADANSLTQFVAMQNHYNLLYREEEREMIPNASTWASGSSPGAPKRAACSPGPALEKRTPPGESPMPSPAVGTPTPTTTSSTSFEPSPKKKRCRWHKSRWRGSCHAPASPLRSWGLPSCRTSRTRSEPSRSRSVTTKWDDSRSPTGRDPLPGTDQSAPIED